MAQRDKVKELVGRGLDSYHTKALQQMDRIEKKNKEQNHKISILTNELDNDYLTKTEEGSVVSLEHSKEGMVYLDELQGNTLVNYCSDGSKELTLNGDIDVEGTNVTLTEGVDNGKVDVVCEGNTLVNIIDGRWYNGTTETKNNRECFKIAKGSSVNHLSITNIKSGVPYTLIYDYTSTELIRGTTNPFGRLHLTLSNESGWVYDVPVKDFESNKSSFVTSISVFTIPTHIQFSSLMITGILRDIEGTVWLDKNILLLEGDWSNKEIPKYFKGMKSVGECEDNKIEILSKKEHLVWEQGTLANANGQPNVNNTRIRTVDFFDGNNVSVVNYDESKYYILYMGYDENKNYVYSSGWIKSSTCPKNYPYIKLVLKIDETTNFAPNDLKEDIRFDRNYNKKEISLNEPLRGIGDNKDKFIKQGGKWYIERRNGKFVVDGSDVAYTSTDNYPSDNAHCILTSKLNNLKLSGKILCDKVSAYDSSIWMATDIGDKCGVSTVSASWGFAVRLTNNLTNVNKTDDEETVKSKFRTYLQSNPITIIYQLETPVYEEITDPTLITYLDKTHISNNSTIPCNMKIQNSGYNAIIKPSTLYTVALDTNKNGTIGINLGGTKTTTTNNVATITTPATLTDDSLRLYGKGIKASKIRLLEGDKTNWIPSYFEGMQSSFEDRLQDDGTYKMEILSGNENKITKEYIELMKDVSNYGSGAYRNLKYYIQLEPQTRYTVSCKEYRELAGSYNILQFTDYDSPNKVLGGFPYQNNASGTSDIVFENRSFTITTGLNGRICFRMYINNWTDKELVKKTIESIKDLKIEKGGKTPYVEGKSNKIQFSSIEPLRSLPNGVKDKFIFKDGKLMIERNTSKSKVNNIENVNKSYGGWNNIVFAYKVEGLISVGASIRNVWSNLLPSRDIAELCNTLGKTGIASHDWGNGKLQIAISGIDTVEKMKEWISKNDLEIVYQIELTYEEVPFELAKIILEGYENGTLFFDTNIPPTVTTTYSGETPIVKATKLNKTEVLNNTTDINDNIVPYLMDMDYRVVCLQLEGGIENISMARLFGGTYEMLQRDILSKRYSKEEYLYRLDTYLSANKITHEEYTKLGDMLND